MTEVRVTGLESDGIELISSLSAEFDSIVDALSVPGMAEVVKDAKPYVVIISNKTPRKIVAFMVCWSKFKGTAIPNSPPAAGTECGLFVAPNAVGATWLDFGHLNDPGIPPGGQRLIGIGFGIPPLRSNQESQSDAPELDHIREWSWVVSITRGQVARIKSQGAGITGIIIRLDAAILDDGLLIGSDTHETLRRDLEGRVKAKQDIFRQIADSLDHGVSVERAFAMPTEQLNLAIPSDIVGFFRREAIGTADILRKRYGDEKIRQLLQEALLKEPFVIHRK